MSDKQVSVKNTIEEYIYQKDWRIKANANQAFSIGGLILNMSGKITANYWLDEVYAKEAGEAHRCGDIHIHDLDFLGGYCCGHSLRALLQEGLNGVGNKTSSNPPKHLSAALGQMVNFLGTMQNEWAGAQAFSSVDTYLAPYIYFDNLDERQLRQHLQRFMFDCNNTTRWGCQAVFSNITLDLSCPEDLRDKPVLIGGVDTGRTYKEFQKEMDMFNSVLMDIMMDGDKDGRPFTFPIPTYNVTNEFNWNSPIVDKVFKMTAKYGLPYFSNYVGGDMKPSDVRSMCCRLRLDLTELLAKGGGLFGSAEQTGSIGVVTLNMARLGFKHKGGEINSLLEDVVKLCNVAKDSLEAKRVFLTQRMEDGLYPFTKRWLGTYRNFFSTIGVNGMNEMVLNYTNGEHDITTEFGQEIAILVLDKIRELMVEFQKETGHLYNLEATPAEGATTRFAREDKKTYGSDIIQAGTEESPFYTNSSQLPVGFTSDPFEALDLQDEIQCKYTGGTVLHLYTGQSLESGDVCKNLVKKVLTNYNLPYVSVTPTFSICPKHGYLSGEHKFCPKCDEELRQRKMS